MTWGRVASLVALEWGEFAVTAMLQCPTPGGGRFEYVTGIRPLQSTGEPMDELSPAVVAATAAVVMGSSGDGGAGVGALSNEHTSGGGGGGGSGGGGGGDGGGEGSGGGNSGGSGGGGGSGEMSWHAHVKCAADFQPGDVMILRGRRVLHRVVGQLNHTQHAIQHPFS